MRLLCVSVQEAGKKLLLFYDTTLSFYNNFSQFANKKKRRDAPYLATLEPPFLICPNLANQGNLIKCLQYNITFFLKHSFNGEVFASEIYIVIISIHML